MRAGGFPGNPGGLIVSILKVAGGRAPAHHARGRGRRTWRPTERTAGARMVPPGEGNEARGDGRRGVGVSHSTAEAGALSPRDPVEGRGHRQGAPLEGKTANTPRLGPVSTSRQRIAELARQAVGMAVAIAWLPGPAGTRRRVAKLSVEEPDAAEPARPDLWGARVSNDPGLPDLREELARLKVEVNEEKSRTVDLGKGESFGFLGFDFRRVLSRWGRWRPLYTPQRKKCTALLRRLRDIFHRYRAQPVREVVHRINPILRGWVRYFAIGQSSRCFSYVCTWVDMKIQRHWLRTRQRPGFGWRRWRWLRLSRAVGVFLDYDVRPYRPAAGSA